MGASAGLRRARGLWRAAILEPPFLCFLHPEDIYLHQLTQLPFEYSYYIANTTISQSMTFYLGVACSCQNIALIFLLKLA